VLDWLFALAGAFCASYLFFFYRELSTRPGQPTTQDLVVAAAGVVLLLEATRRALGLPMVIVAVVFLAYTFGGPYMPDLIAHKGASLSRVASHQWLTTEGVFGVALGVSSGFIFLFVLFGSLLDKAGAGNYFIKSAFALLGHMRGGHGLTLHTGQCEVARRQRMRDPDRWIDVAWVEEAERVSEASWNVLIPTIRKPGSEIWVTFNPDLDTDPTFRRFVVAPPPGAWVVKVSSHDNPWLPEELRAEREYLYRVDPDAAAHVWGGETRQATEAQILRGKWRVEPFEPLPTWDGPYQGADFGFAQDPTALVRVWHHDRTLYVEHEAYRVGLELDHTAEHWLRHVPEADRYVTRADSARPESISYLKRHGFPRIEGVKKWPGSVEDGIAHLRAYEGIVLHPRCTHAADEARHWSYKVDRLTGDVLPDVVDAHNHVWDAVRYALAPRIRQRDAGRARTYASTASLTLR